MTLKAMHKTTWILLLLVSTTWGVQTKGIQAWQPFNERVEWFRQDRLGMFVHWSAGAVTGARWQGEPLRNPLPYGEWLRCRNRVPRLAYDKLIAQMSISREQVDHWAALAQAAGMKYLIFVAKHHDGLAYWPSEVSDYTFQRLTGHDTDMVQWVKEACDKYGLKLGFYYSQWHDWEHPDGWGNFWDYEDDPARFKEVNWRDDLGSGRLFRPSLTAKQFQQYWQEKSVPQVRELIERYDPDLFWFDMYVPRETTIISEQNLRELLAMIRTLSPRCLVNTRLGIAEVGPEGVDYETMGDNQLPSETFAHPWESSVTLNRSWGYNRDDQAWKPVGFFVRAFSTNISRGGNLQINIGPRADGTLPPETDQILTEIGRCLKQNRGRGFYGCGPAPLNPDRQDWGLATQSLKAPNKLFLHVFEWPLDGMIRMNGLQTAIRSAVLAATGKPLTFTQQGLIARITGPTMMPVGYDTVIELTLAGPPTVDNSFIGEKNLGGYYLAASQATRRAISLQPKADGGWIPLHLANWHRQDASATWKIYVPEPGQRSISLCYACPIHLAGKPFIVQINNKAAFSTSTQATHPDWQEYRAFNLGNYHFKYPGFYEVNLHTEGKLNKELFHLAWIHIE